MAFVALVSVSQTLRSRQVALNLPSGDVAEVNCRPRSGRSEPDLRPELDGEGRSFLFVRAGATALVAASSSHFEI